MKGSFQESGVTRRRFRKTVQSRRCFSSIFGSWTDLCRGPNGTRNVEPKYHMREPTWGNITHRRLVSGLVPVTMKFESDMSTNCFDGSFFENVFFPVRGIQHGDKGIPCI